MTISGEISAAVGELPAYDDGAPLMVRGAGLRLVDSDGRAYVDAVSGTFNLPLGYNHPHVVDAVARQLRNAAHLSSEFSAPYGRALIERLLDRSGGKLSAGWIRDAIGSTAIECAVKIAQKATGRSDVITLFFSHHGQTVFTTGISGNARRRSDFPATHMPLGLRVPAPYCYRCFYAAERSTCELMCVSRIRDFLRHAVNAPVACMIVEPILGNGGNIVPPPGYFAALRHFCDTEGILLIADEVQTGLGRTGRFLGSETMGLDPDIVVLAKGLGGIGIPIAAVMMRKEFDVLSRSQHSFTTGGCMLGIAAAHAVIDVLSDSYLAEVRARGEYLGTRLEQLRRFDCVGDVRGVGMMWGIEIIDSSGAPDPTLTLRIIEHARRTHGLIVRGSEYGEGNVVKVRPALIATHTDIDDIVDRLTSALAGVG